VYKQISKQILDLPAESVIEIMKSLNDWKEIVKFSKSNKHINEIYKANKLHIFKNYLKTRGYNKVNEVDKQLMEEYFKSNHNYDDKISKKFLKFLTSNGVKSSGCFTSTNRVFPSKKDLKFGDLIFNYDENEDTVFIYDGKDFIDHWEKFIHFKNIYPEKWISCDMFDDDYPEFQFDFKKVEIKNLEKTDKDFIFTVLYKDQNYVFISRKNINFNKINDFYYDKYFNIDHGSLLKEILKDYFKKHDISIKLGHSNVFYQARVIITNGVLRNL
jgi:hypothetical protein